MKMDDLDLQIKYTPAERQFLLYEYFLKRLFVGEAHPDFLHRFILQIRKKQSLLLLLAMLFIWNLILVQQQSFL